MKAVWILLCLLISGSSCSSQRYSLETLHEDERLEDRAAWKQLEDSIRADWLDVRQVIRLSEENRQVWIWPEGEFRYQRDSGFVGSASMLLVEEAGRSLHVEEDSVTAHIDRVIQVDSAERRSESIREAQSESRREVEKNKLSRKRSKTLIRSTVLLGIFMLTAVWIFWRWKRHRCNYCV